MEEEYKLGERSEKRLKEILSAVRTKGSKRKFDCVLGISGGRDSIYTLYLAKKIWGLNPIAVHFNDGFGNPVAGENMRVY
jgi:tRNA(Ile)-lysidine synthase TilS/MesJ